MTPKQIREMWAAVHRRNQPRIIDYWLREFRASRMLLKLGKVK